MFLGSSNWKLFQILYLIKMLFYKICALLEIYRGTVRNMCDVSNWVSFDMQMTRNLSNMTSFRLLLYSKYTKFFPQTHYQADKDNDRHSEFLNSPLSLVERKLTVLILYENLSKNDDYPKISINHSQLTTTQIIQSLYPHA